MNVLAWVHGTGWSTGAVALLLAAWTAPAMANSCAEVRALLDQGHSLAEVADALGTSQSVVQHACLQPRSVVVPSNNAPAGRAPVSAPGPAPFGAAGPAPMGAAGPAPMGAAGPAPMGAPGPAPMGAGGATTTGSASTSPNKTR